MSRKSGERNSQKLSLSLYRALLSLKSPAECEDFLSDLCTPTELEALADRWEVAQLVNQAVPYREIQQQTSVSTATITRVARALVHGSGGYRKIINRLQKKNRNQRKSQ